jgi:hypothetical protein
MDPELVEMIQAAARDAQRLEDRLEGIRATLKAPDSPRLPGGRDQLTFGCWALGTRAVKEGLRASLRPAS